MTGAGFHASTFVTILDLLRNDPTFFHQCGHFCRGAGLVTCCRCRKTDQKHCTVCEGGLTGNGQGHTQSVWLTTKNIWRASLNGKAPGLNPGDPDLSGMGVRIVPPSAIAEVQR